MKARPFWVALAPVFLLVVLVIGTQFAPLQSLLLPPKPKTPDTLPIHFTPPPSRKADPESQQIIEAIVRRAFLALIRGADSATLLTFKAPSQRQFWQPSNSPASNPLSGFSLLKTVQSITFSNAWITRDFATIRFIADGADKSTHPRKEYFSAELFKEGGDWYINHFNNPPVLDTTNWLKTLDSYFEAQSPSQPRGKKATSPSSSPPATDKRNTST